MRRKAKKILEKPFVVSVVVFVAVVDPLHLSPLFLLSFSLHLSCVGPGWARCMSKITPHATPGF